MKRLFSVALGVIAALGGFVDIGELVFNSQAGALFGYQPLWAVPIGVIGIIVFSDLSGRIAIVTRKANFDIIRDRYPRWLSTLTLVAALVSSLITLSAEMGGLGLVLHYVLGWNAGFFALVGLVVLVAASVLLPFGAIERIFGYLGLGLVVFIVAAVHHGPDWAAIGAGFVPSGGSTQYWYFVVALIAAGMMPYEIYFFSSGTLEEDWTIDDLGTNRANTMVGFPLGGLVAAAITVVAAQQMLPLGMTPNHLGTTLMMATAELGPVAFYAAVVGAFFAIGGATIDSAFSCGYALAQRQRWDWGKREGLRRSPRWTATLLAAYGIGYAVVQTRVDPVSLTEYAVIASAVAMPLSFLPVILVSQDRSLMGNYAAGIPFRVLGWLSFAVVCVVAVAGPVLLVLTHMGQSR